MLFFSCYNTTAVLTTESFRIILVNQFPYLGNNISLMESIVTICIGKAWTAIGSLLPIWKSDHYDQIEWKFLQAVAVSVILYGCTNWTSTKCLVKKQDGNYTRILHVVLKKSYKAAPVQPLASNFTNIQARWTRQARYGWRSRNEIICGVLLWNHIHGHGSVGWTT